jgi:ATP-dependent Clp protease ATP-binding subunit ClpA
VRFDDNLITGTEEIEETGLLVFISRQCDQLAEAVRRALQLGRHSYELEKAHGDALDISLQIMDGMLTDGMGRTDNFNNTLLVMSSNVGSKRILEMARGEDEPVVTAAAPMDTATLTKDAALVDSM